MDPTLPPSMGAHFARLTDPRVERTRVHRLGELVTIALCAILCGANDWVAVETFGHAKEAWLRTFLALPGGIPSHHLWAGVCAARPGRAPAVFRGLGAGRGRGSAGPGRGDRREDESRLGGS